VIVGRRAAGLRGWRLALRWYQDFSTRQGWFLAHASADQGEFREPAGLAGWGTLAGPAACPGGGCSASADG